MSRTRQGDPAIFALLRAEGPLRHRDLVARMTATGLHPYDAYIYVVAALKRQRGRGTIEREKRNDKHWWYRIAEEDEQA